VLNISPELFDFFRGAAMFFEDIPFHPISVAITAALVSLPPSNARLQQGPLVVVAVGLLTVGPVHLPLPSKPPVPVERLREASLLPPAPLASVLFLLLSLRTLA